MTSSPRWYRIFVVTLSAIGFAQTQDSSNRSAKIQVQSDLVLINAFVTDSRGSLVTDLAASQFPLFEDGQEQVIKSCSSEDVRILRPD